jgi:hypothetical protein
MSFYTATNAAPRPERASVLPQGTYRAVIMRAEMKPTKRGDGEFLELEFVVLEGEHTNRKFWDRLNLKNPNETAVQIAREAMDELCFVTGKLSLTSAQELVGSTVAVQLKVKQNSQTKEPEQAVVRFLKDTGPGTVAAAPTRPTPTPVASNAVPAWAQPRPAA